MTSHTVIAGAGISGLSVAWSLLHLGHKVTLLDQGTVGSESSWAGGGILSPLLPWDYPEPVTSLALRSMTTYEQWVTQIESTSGQQAEFWRCGMTALDVTNREQALAWCSAHGLATALLPPHLAAGLNDRQSIFLPAVAQVRNPRLVAALRAAVLRMGAVIHEHCPAVGVLTDGRHVTALQTRNESIAADQVVITTGAWAGIDLNGIAAVPNIRPMRGQMLLFKLEPGDLNTILFRDGLYLIPRRDGHVLVGSTIEDAGFNKMTDAATCQRLHGEAAALLPQLAGLEPVQQWAGLRPGSPANIPVIDRHPEFDNVYINTGHFRYGVTMAPASAELLVSLMENTTPALDPAPYRWQAAEQRNWAAA